MKILHVIPSVDRHDGGPATAVVGMVRALVERGVDARIVTTHSESGEAVWAADVPLITFRRWTGGSTKISPALSSWLQTNTREFDLVHIHAVFSHSSLAAASAARRASVPFIVRPLGSLSAWSLQQKSLKKRVAMSLGVGRMLRDAAAVHATSSSEAGEVCAAFPHVACFVAPIGVDEALFSPSPAARLRRVLFLGRLHEKKRVELLIEAFRAIPRARRDGWELWIAGSGDRAYVDAVRATADSEPAIRFCGWVDSEAKRELFDSASLFALPSHHENFGISVAEAMAVGVPVMVSRGVDLSSAVASGDAGWVIDAATVDGWAVALEAVINDPGELARRSRNATVSAEAYRWGHVAELLESRYREIIDSGHVSRNGAEGAPA